MYPSWCRYWHVAQCCVVINSLLQRLLRCLFWLCMHAYSGHLFYRQGVPRDISVVVYIVDNLPLMQTYVGRWSRFCVPQAFDPNHSNTVRPFERQTPKRHRLPYNIFGKHVMQQLLSNLKCAKIMTWLPSWLPHCRHVMYCDCSIVQSQT